MGDLRDCSTESNAVVVEERSLAAEAASVSSSPSSSSSPSCPSRAVIREECLEKAEEVMRGLLDLIQPNFPSEERRAAVIGYIQRLIRRCLGCEVFLFGSVPLRTYLPDGDIDLTAFGGMNAEETLAHNVFAVLEREDQNEDAEFLVKDVRLIWAELFRIRSAFSFGVRKLEKVLCDPDMDIANKLREIFSNTLDRHGSGQRPDVQDIVSEYDNLKLSDEEITSSVHLKEEQQNDERVVSSASLSEPDTLGSSVSLSDHISCEACDIAKSQSSMASNGSHPSRVIESSSEMGKVQYISHSFNSHSAAETGVTCNGFGDFEHAEYFVPEVTTTSGSMFASEGCLKENNVASSSEVSHSTKARNGNLIASPRSWSSVDNSGTWAPQGSMVPNSLPDLSGTFENHLRSLCHGRWCHEYAFSVQMSHTAPLFIPQYHVDKSWDVVYRSVQHKRDIFSKMNHNGVPKRPTYYPVNVPPISCAPFGMEESPKPRGTGTYFPNTDHYRDKNSSGRGRNQVTARSPRGNVRLKSSMEVDFVEKSDDLLEPYIKSITSDPRGSSSLGVLVLTPTARHNYPRMRWSIVLLVKISRPPIATLRMMGALEMVSFGPNPSKM